MPQIPFYDDPVAESTLRMGPSGKPLVMVSNVAHISGRVENVFDDQMSVGKSFSRVKFRGIKSAEFTVSFIVLPEEEADFWQKVIPLTRQKGKKGNAPPMDVVNPQINRLGVSTVFILSTDIDPPNARDGRAVTMKLREWSAAPVKPKADTSSKGNRDPLNPDAAGSSKANQ